MALDPRPETSKTEIPSRTRNDYMRTGSSRRASPLGHSKRRQGMRMASLLSVAVLLALAGCSVQADPGGEPQDKGTYENVILPPPPSSPVFSCTATTNCATPFDGVSRSCSGTSCAAFADRVVCGGVTTSCTSTCVSCSANATCESVCGGPGTGFCNTSTRCCVCGV